jgi:hypothetical protein
MGFNGLNGWILNDEVRRSRFEGTFSWQWRSNLLIKLTPLNFVYKKILALATKNGCIYRVFEE